MKKILIFVLFAMLMAVISRTLEGNDVWEFINGDIVMGILFGYMFFQLVTLPQMSNEVVAKYVHQSAERNMDKIIENILGQVNEKLKVQSDKTVQEFKYSIKRIVQVLEQQNVGISTVEIVKKMLQELGDETVANTLQIEGYSKMAKDEESKKKMNEMGISTKSKKLKK